MHPSPLFCPGCGKQTLHAIKNSHVLCEACNFIFYRNAATATAAIIRVHKEILFTVRANDPGKGLLDLPGGFVDPGEGAEEGLRRELQEELGLDAGPMRYIGSLPNDYLYRDVLYDTCDVFFELVYDDHPNVAALDEISELRWLTLDELDFEKLAFSSQQKILQSLKEEQLDPQA